MRRWYHKLGVVSWYRNEWVRIVLSFRTWLLLDVHLKPRCGYFRVDVGGVVHRRSLFGNPSAVEPRWSFTHDRHHPLNPA